MKDNQQEKRAVMFLRSRWNGQAGQDQAAEYRHIAMQRKHCETAAEQLGATLVREYVEYGGAGALEKRPVLKQMLDELLALQDVEYVICVSLDRLARTTADLAAIQLELETAGAALVLTNQAHLPAAHRQLANKFAAAPVAHGGK